jgi:hypothetical protein
MRISIQEYTEKLEAILEPLDRNGICDLVRNLAKGVPVAERTGFLQALAPESKVVKKEENHTEDSDSVQESLAILLEEIMERSKLIENGNYDELDEWSYEDYDYYSDEGPPCLTEDHESEIRAIMQDADDLFLDREFGTAARIYQALIQFAKELKEKTWESIPVDAPTLGKNYCQAVFESATEHSFPAELLAALYFVKEHLEFNSFFPGIKGCLFLQEILTDAPLLKDASFLRDWNLKMELKPSDPLGQMLKVEGLLLSGQEPEALRYLEAQRAEEGIWGWLTYIYCQMQTACWDKIPPVCPKIYPLLEDSFPKNTLGEWMQQAGEALKQPRVIAAGIRYRFAVYPSTTLLGELLLKVSDRTILEEEWVSWSGLLEKDSYHDDLKILLRLFLGDFNKVCTPSRPFAAVGWSDGSDSAVLVVAIWIVLCGEKPLPAPVNDLLFWLFHNQSIMMDDLTQVAAGQKALKETLCKSLALVEMTSDEKLQWLDKTRKVVETRVDTIVSNKRRGAYARAAEAVAAWCAVAKLLNKEQDAQSLIASLLQRYNRFSAFKRELNERI